MTAPELRPERIVRLRREAHELRAWRDQARPGARLVLDAEASRREHDADALEAEGLPIA